MTSPSTMSSKSIGLPAERDCWIGGPFGRVNGPRRTLPIDERKMRTSKLITDSPCGTEEEAPMHPGNDQVGKHPAMFADKEQVQRRSVAQE